MSNAQPQVSAAKRTRGRKQDSGGTRTSGVDPRSNGGPRPTLSARQARERALFDALRADDEESLAVEVFMNALCSMGLLADDPRLLESVAALENVTVNAKQRGRMSYDEFRTVIAPAIVLIERALQGNLVIPDFEAFCADIAALYEKTKGNEAGKVASYIPQLARVNPDQYGVAICTVDGQRFSTGDARMDFCVQSCCKPVNYCIALECSGEKIVHQHIGREPSGHSFNELTLNRAGLPHNPMINAGAVMACSLIRPDLTSADRFDLVIDVWTRLAGGKKPGFSNPTYLSERQTADRNFALGYFMREKGAFPSGTDLAATLEFFFQCCSLEMTTEAMSVVAATFANGGICPTTGERVFEPDTVRKCLSLMSSCGMYDFSGEWAFSIGMPGKSGVGGAVYAAVPNVAGLCAWSPRLDELGNSVRGVDFFRELVSTFKFHNYDDLVGAVRERKDPRLARSRLRCEGVTELCWAASEGDLGAVRRLVARGVDIDTGDYDGRTALHLATCGRHKHVIDYLIARGGSLNPRDRWGGSPLDDAYREGHADIAALLERHGARRCAR